MVPQCQPGGCRCQQLVLEDLPTISLSIMVGSSSTSVSARCDRLAGSSCPSAPPPWSAEAPSSGPIRPETEFPEALAPQSESAADVETGQYGGADPEQDQTVWENSLGSPWRSRRNGGMSRTRSLPVAVSIAAIITESQLVGAVDLI